MAFVSGNQVGTELCEAFGLNPNHIAVMDIHISPSEATSVTIVRYVRDDEVPKIREVVERYRLVDADDERVR